MGPAANAVGHFARLGPYTHVDATPHSATVPCPESDLESAWFRLPSLARRLLAANGIHDVGQFVAMSEVDGNTGIGRTYLLSDFRPLIMCLRESPFHQYHFNHRLLGAPGTSGAQTVHAALGFASPH